MALTLEQRVEDLKRRVFEMTVASNKKEGTNWKETFGLSRDDEGFREMVRLGQEYRRTLPREDEEC